MSLLLVVVGTAAVLSVAYATYGRLLVRLFDLDDRRPTPAVTERDDVDYVPTPANLLLGQHFSAIAAAGPIVGPILAASLFGWLPALIWIVVGSVLIGGVHDFASLVASIRHRARAIPELVREYMSNRAYLLFLAFVWLSLVYIVIAFTDVTAAAFVGRQDLTQSSDPTAETLTTTGPSAPTAAPAADIVQIEVTGAGIASSSLIYLGLSIAMGLLLKFTRVSLGVATLVFLPLVALAIGYGQRIPLPMEANLGDNGEAVARRIWSVLLLVYCGVASVLPMWLLLQPRGHLGGYFLYAALLGGAGGLIFGGQPIKYPAFIGWESANGVPIVPMLFITIACGACSGFHSIICSGTTSKQLARESDAKIIGYGAMLLEAMVAVVSLCCVMTLAVGDPLLKRDANYLYAVGIGRFLAVLHVPIGLAVAFGMMAFTTFVYDTLDVCTRLGRYILEELFGWRSALGRYCATVATISAPAGFILLQPVVGPDGKPPQLWKVFWQLFGASNQLLAALALLAVTVWLWRTRRAWWIWLVTGLPAAWMYAMSMTAMLYWIRVESAKPNAGRDPVLWVAVLLAVLGALLLIEAVAALLRPAPRPTEARA